MSAKQAFLVLGTLLAAAIIPARADDARMQDRVLGKADAPVTVEEFISLTCPHCAEFYIKTLPEIEKAYVDTGKVKFILRDFPLDGPALKAAVVARCMPEDQFYPFIRILYENQQGWALAQDPEKILIQYAKLGGLPEEKTRECLKDTALQDAVVAERTDATKNYNVESTPTFILNKGEGKIEGARQTADFSAALDKLLTAKKK